MPLGPPSVGPSLGKIPSENILFGYENFTFCKLFRYGVQFFRMGSNQLKVSNLTIWLVGPLPKKVGPLTKKYVFRKVSEVKSKVILHGSYLRGVQRNGVQPTPSSTIFPGFLPSFLAFFSVNHRVALLLGCFFFQ